MAQGFYYVRINSFETLVEYLTFKALITTASDDILIFDFDFSFCVRFVFPFRVDPFQMGLKEF